MADSGSSDAIKALVANSDDLNLSIGQRDLFSGKLENGRVMVVGGSEDFHGAPALASNAAYNLLAALRVGAGYVAAYVPRSIVDVNRAVAPDIIVRPLSGDNITEKDLKVMEDAVAHFDSLVIGSGIGRLEGSMRSVAKLAERAIGLGKRVVIDADGLYAIKEFRPNLSKDVVITPNDKEFELLSGRAVSRNNLSERIEAAVALSIEVRTVVLLKGHNTVITDGKRTKVVKSRSSALAVMGTGDVLAGIIGAYAAKNNDAFRCAVAGAYLHSTIGDRLHSEKGDHIIPSDVVERIPSVLKKFD